MGLFGGGNSAKKASRNLREGINRASETQSRAYNQALARINPAYSEAQGYLGTGNDAILAALQQAYGDSMGLIGGSQQNQLDAIRQGVTQSGGYYQPYINAGTKSLANLSGMTGPVVDLSADPGYRFRQQQGQSAIQNSAASRGGLLGGNTLKALQSYSQDLASQEYQNAFNRAQQQYQNDYLRNLALAGLGERASSGASQSALWGAGNAADAYRWGGAVQSGLASGYGRDVANQAGRYYGSLADLGLNRMQTLNAIDLAKAGMQSDYQMQSANASAAREVQQGNQRNALIGSLLNLGTAGLGGFLSMPSVYGGIDRSIGNWFSGGDQRYPVQAARRNISDYGAATF